MDHGARVYNDVFEMLPSVENPSPLVRINRLCPSPEFTLYAKLEWMNPLGSLKDRAAAAMLRDLELRGELENGRGLVAATSGNTGISLSALARARGHALRAVVHSRVPAEMKVLMRIAGAELDVAGEGPCSSPGSIEPAVGLAKTHAKVQRDVYALADHTSSERNVQAHMETTGPELWRQTDGKITHVFLSLGTCGTATGAGRFLRQKNPNIKIIAVQPTEGHDLPGLRDAGQLDKCKLFDGSLIGEIVEIDYELAYERVLQLFREEALPASPSCGLIYEGARRVIERERRGFGVMIFPDSVYKYASELVKHMPELAGEGQG